MTLPKNYKRNKRTKEAKPFVKWAGGKGNLLTQLEDHLPLDFDQHNNLTYVEPFVGGGAMLFHVLTNHHNIGRVIINDINQNLISCFRIIQEDPEPLIAELETLRDQYYAIDKKEERGVFYYHIRELFNQNHNFFDVHKAALFIFLNRTCFNGLYRENKSGNFNVPCGYFVHPQICNAQLLREDHALLQGVEILNGPYQNIMEHLDDGPAFVYLDPPYRPLIAGTENFSQYNSAGFNDIDQQQLHDFCIQLTNAGKTFMQSNSDSRNLDGTLFFEDLYNDFNVGYVVANRSINNYNSHTKKQREVLIKNFEQNML